MSKLEELRRQAAFSKHRVFNPDGADYLFEGRLLFQHKADTGDKSVLIKVFESRSGKFLIEDQIQNRVHLFSDFPSIFGCIGYESWAKDVYRQLGIEEFNKI